MAHADIKKKDTTNNFDNQKIDKIIEGIRKRMGESVRESKPLPKHERVTGVNMNRSRAGRYILIKELSLDFINTA